MAPYFNLVLFQGIVRKQGPLEPLDMFYHIQKLAGISHRSFAFTLHILIYHFY